jgi:hypothetical protein
MDRTPRQLLLKNKGLVLGPIKPGAPMRFQTSIAKGELFISISDGQPIILDLSAKTANGWTM